MSYIFMPYALGNFRLYSFKEITLSEYVKYEHAIHNMKQIYDEQFRDELSEVHAAIEVEIDLYDKHKKLGPKYIKAKQQLEEFKKANYLILCKGEELQDSDCPMRLSWILFGGSREEALKQHMSKYKNIYDRLKSLQKQVYELEPYSDSNINETISRAKWAAEESAKYANAKNREKWEADRNNRIQKELAILSDVRAFGFIVKQLSINTYQSTSNVSCQRQSIHGYAPEQVKETLINQKIQIIR